MKTINKFLQETSAFNSGFVIHQHTPRSGSYHFDLRFIDSKTKKLNSFAFGKDFDKKHSSKIIGVRTKDHNERWLTLKSYRLTVFDEGKVDILAASTKYFELNFKGKKLKGKYKLFKIKSKRDDNWLLVKH